MLSAIARLRRAAPAGSASVASPARTLSWRIALHRGLPALLGFCLGSRRIIDADVFWHLSMGRAVLREHSRVVTEPSALYSWTEPCVAKDWLWDVSTYAIYKAGGFGLLAFLPSVFGAAIGYRAARLLEVGRDPPPRAMHTLLAIFALSACAEILDMRPNLIFLTLLLACIELSLRFVRAESSRRLPLAAALVGMQLFWAQVHSSLVYGPVVFGLIAVEAELREHAPFADSRHRLVQQAGVLMAMLAACTTGAAGLGVFQLVLTHAAGDATRHISDMRPFEWGEFSLDWHVPLAITLFALLGGAGVVAAGARSGFGIGLILLGAALTANSGRFVFSWSLLLLPWAAAGVRALESAISARSFERLERSVACLALFAVWVCAGRVDSQSGPLFTHGLRPGGQPLSAARYLATLPQGSRVFSEYTTGAPLGFWLDGHARTFVDARTLLYFDDTDWAVARDMLAHREAVARGFARYGFDAAVVARDSSICPVLEANWVAVVVEARHTTFVPRGRGHAVTGLSACGPFYLRADACDTPDAEWQATLQRQRKLDATSPFLSLMAAGVQLQCKRGAPDTRALPSEADAREFLATFRLYRAWTLLLTGERNAALDVVRAALDDDDALAARILLEPAAGELPAADAKQLLERALRVMDDNAPPPMRVHLATMCVATGDAECVRFQALRAFLAGDQSARALLEWAAKNHPKPRIRTDLAAWLK